MAELERAKSAVRTIEEEVKKCETEVNKYCDKLKEKERQCTQKMDKIAKCKRTIEQIEQSLVQVSEQRNSITQIQEKVRSTVHLLGTLAGRANVAKTHTEHVVCLSPVVNILKEIIKLMLQILENRKYEEILSNPEVSADIQSLQDIYKNVSAINDQQALKEIQFY